ncbi:MAG: MinD/ParA family protein [Lachnospirales bacterium]
MIDQATKLRSLIQEKEDSIEIKKISSRSKVFSVSSGKGGVGKSNFVANLAISLSRLGKEVIIIDADLGLANIEVLFDVMPKKTLKNVIFDGEDILSVIDNGPLGIKFLSGGSGIKEITKISKVEQERLINSLSVLDEKFDYILIDTGAGISDLILNFIKASDESIILCTPEPTSITDSYALIKVMADYLKENNRNLNVIVNRVDREAEGAEIFQKLQVATDRFLGVNLNYFGQLPDDTNLVKSVKTQVPICISVPHSSYAKAIGIVARSIANISVDAKSIENNEKVKSNFFNRLIKVFGK